MELSSNAAVFELWSNQKFFITEELVSPEVYSARGDLAIELFNPTLIYTLIELRTLFDRSMVINSWEWGGEFTQRGLRSPNFYGDRPAYSQHIFGNAIDCDVHNLTADQAREKIKVWKKEGRLPFLTALETGVNWVHFDCRLTGRNVENGLFLFANI